LQVHLELVLEIAVVESSPELAGARDCRAGAVRLQVNEYLASAATLLAVRELEPLLHRQMIRFELMTS
jgi:hypothetical protein